MTSHPLFYAALIIVGILLLTAGLKSVLRFSNSALLLDVPMHTDGGTFAVPNEGTFAIWQAGKKLRKVPVKMPALLITNMLTGQAIYIRHTIGSTYVNDFKQGRLMLYSFKAPAGDYRLTLDHTAAPAPAPLLSSFRGATNPKPGETYFVQIREKKSTVLLVFGILTMIAGFACVLVGGIVGASVMGWITLHSS